MEDRQPENPNRVVYYHEIDGTRRRIRETSNGTSALYREDTVGRFTAAVDCPTPQTLLIAMEMFVSGGVAKSSVVAGLGVARVHPHDNFDRRIGRALAYGQIRYETMVVKSVSVFDSGRMYVDVESPGGFAVQFYYIRGKESVGLVRVSARP